MGAVISFVVQLASETCAECGIEFALPTATMKHRRDDKKEFFCPNGHKNLYTESEADRLRKQLEAAQARAVRLERDAAEASERAQRNWKTLQQTSGKLSALRKRVKHGVCPCCKRTFQQLARHMATKHPGYVVEEPLPKGGGK